MRIKINDTFINIDVHDDANCVEVSFDVFDNNKDNKHLVITPSASSNKAILIGVVETKDLNKHSNRK